MTEEENLREQDQCLRNQIQNLLESEEGRTLWAGSIEFRSIQASMNSISIGYVDATGAKTLTCEEPPREEFRTAMQAMSFYYSDIAGNYGVRMPLQAFFNVEKVVPKRDKKSGALKGVRLGGGSISKAALPRGGSARSKTSLRPITCSAS